MAINVTHLLSFLETDQFFQIELLTLLVSLLFSLLLSNSFPYFVVSAICFLATAGSLTRELFTGTASQFPYAEATTTLTLAVLVLATFIIGLVKGLPDHDVRLHAAAVLGFSLYLAVKAFRILEDTARPVDADVSYNAQQEHPSTYTDRL